MRDAGHDPRLDGLRGIAIGLVVLSHGGYRLPLDGLAGEVYRTVVDLGFSGVDLFFVLSGFLITRILLRTRRDPHYFRNFYARRTLRIFPAYYAWLFFLLVLVPHIDFFAPYHPFWELRDVSSLWYWLYASNFAMAWHGAWLHPLLSLTWSLAIEEQFYLVWPWVVRTLSPRRLVQVCVGCLVLAPLLRTALLAAEVSPIAAFVLTPCRFDGLAAGALVALVAAQPGGPERLLRWARRGVPAVGAALLAGVVTIRAGWVPEGSMEGLAHQPLMSSVGFSGLALFYAGVLVFAAFGDARPVRLLAFAPLRVWGRYSYAIYLTHTFVGGIVILHVFNPMQHPGWAGALFSYALEWSAQLGAGALSWYLLETHFLRLKQRFA